VLFANPDVIGQVWHGIGEQPLTSNPHVATFVSPGGLPSALVVSQVVSQTQCGGDGPMTLATASYFPLGTTSGTSALAFAGESTAAAPNNSCPFGPAASDSRDYFGLTASSSGNALWLSGISGCPPVTQCAITSPMDGLVVNSPPTSGNWYTVAADAATLGLEGPLVNTGYDDSILAMNSRSRSSPGATRPTSPPGPPGFPR
jgi:hypothetical protein